MLAAIVSELQFSEHIPIKAVLVIRVVNPHEMLDVLNAEQLALWLSDQYCLPLTYAD